MIATNARYSWPAARSNVPCGTNGEKTLSSAIFGPPPGPPTGYVYVYTASRSTKSTHEVAPTGSEAVVARELRRQLPDTANCHQAGIVAPWKIMRMMLEVVD